MRKIIENPRIFISYAWGTQEYQKSVLDFATLLTFDGIDVILDKWVLEAGNDTYDFMEKCVKAPDVNFVLMLLDKNYSDKADKREGGVGVETQIISAEVYNDLNQTKFIPIIFQKGENGEVYKPTYLKSKLHFDLSTDENSEEYQSLVRTLLGVPTYPKPLIGKKPIWIENALEILPEFQGLALTKKIYDQEFETSLFELNKILIEKIKSFSDLTINEKLLQALEETLPIRNTYISLIEKAYTENSFAEIVSSFFESWRNSLNELLQYEKAISAFLLHECFLYTIALLQKKKLYKNISLFIKRTYFIKENRVSKTADFKNVFYMFSATGLISNALNSIENKNFYSGVAELWMRRIFAPDFTKEMIVSADVLLYNLHILCIPNADWFWFPMTYCYHESLIQELALRLKSKQQCQNFMDLFDVESIEDIKLLMKNMVELLETSERPKQKNRYRYNMCYDEAPLLIDFITIEEIASLN